MATDFQIVSGVLLLVQNGQPVKAITIPGSSGTDKPQPLLAGRFAYALAWPSVHIFDAAAGKLRKVQPFAEIDGKTPEYRSLTVARSAHAIFFTANLKDVLLIARVDLTTGLVTYRHRVPGLQPDFYARRPMEAEDGVWIIPLNRRTENSFSKGVICIDPVKGTRQETFIPALNYGDDFSNLSPNGMFALRPDMTILHRAEDRASGRPLFGLTVQLWLTRPLQFVRRLTVGWFTVDEMPNGAFYANDGQKFQQDAAGREALCAEIANTTERLALAPDGAIQQSDFPEPFTSSDSEFGLLMTNWRDFAFRQLQRAHWAPDSGGFWHCIHGFAGFTSLDGGSSARYFLPHYGVQSTSGGPSTRTPSRIEPLPGRRALLWYGNGLAEIEAPPALPSAPLSLPASLGTWAAAVAPSTPTEFFRVAIEANEQARTIRVPLGGLDASHCMAAILALRDEIARDLHGRIIEDQVNVVFRRDGQEMDEFAFFEHAEKFGSVMAPSLRALMQTLLDTPDLQKRHMYLFSIGEEGKGILHGAAKAFARLDPDPIALTKRYGEIMDPEHEYSFYGGVVPALYANLGWTHDTLEFGIWLLRMNYYNSISHEDFWNKDGFGAAAEKFFPDPKAFATHFLDRYEHYGFEPAETSKNYPIYFIDVLDREITRKSPWTQALFEAWKLMPRAE